MYEIMYVSTDEGPLPFFIALATLRDLIAGLKVGATGKTARIAFTAQVCDDDPGDPGEDCGQC